MALSFGFAGVEKRKSNALTTFRMSDHVTPSPLSSLDPDYEHCEYAVMMEYLE